MDIHHEVCAEFPQGHYVHDFAQLICPLCKKDLCYKRDDMILILLEKFKKTKILIVFMAGPPDFDLNYV